MRIRLSSVIACDGTGLRERADATLNYRLRRRMAAVNLCHYDFEFAIVRQGDHLFEHSASLPPMAPRVCIEASNLCTTFESPTVRPRGMFSSTCVPTVLSAFPAWLARRRRKARHPSPHSPLTKRAPTPLPKSRTDLPPRGVSSHAQSSFEKADTLPHPFLCRSLPSDQARPTTFARNSPRTRAAARVRNAGFGVDPVLTETENRPPRPTSDFITI